MDHDEHRGGLVGGGHASGCPAASSAASSPDRGRAATFRGADERRPDDDRVGEPGDLRGLLAGPDPEPDAERQVGDRPAAGDQFRCGGRDLIAGAGHPHGRGDVQEPAGGRRGQRDPLGRGRRGDQKNRVQVVAAVAASQGPASSTIRSGVMTPEPPAAARSRAKVSTP